MENDENKLILTMAAFAPLPEPGSPTCSRRYQKVLVTYFSHSILYRNWRSRSASHGRGAFQVVLSNPIN